ncbi:MAG: SRPBCC family protein [Actinobacteria bacterium]|nr:SRPBCC family protein [Actinomycetota bacterium]
MSHQIEVSKVIASTPEQVYALVSDLCRMGEWSPENTGGKWIKGATGPAVGAKFEGTNQLGKKKWKTLSTVTAADPGRAFAFDVTAAGMKVAGWGFSLEPAEGGTKVTHYWDDHRSPVIAKLTGMAIGVKDRSVHNKANMETTLEQLAAAV